MDSNFPVFDIEDIDFDIAEIESPNKSHHENAATAKTTTTNRFANLSESDLDKLLQDKQSESTKKTTNWSVSTFKGNNSDHESNQNLESKTI